MEEFSDIGKYLRIARKKIKKSVDFKQSHPAIIEAISNKLQIDKRNFLPVIVEEVDEDIYEVLLNSHILEAAEKANLDFIWCLVADAERRKQIEVESKQRFEINLMTASEETIANMLDYIQTNHPNWHIDPKKTAKLIVENRQDKWKNRKPFKPITTLRCGIGDRKLTILAQYFIIA